MSINLYYYYYLTPYEEDRHAYYIPENVLDLKRFSKIRLLKGRSHASTANVYWYYKEMVLLPHWVYSEGRFHVLSSRHQCNQSDCTLRIYMAAHSPVQRWTVPLCIHASLCSDTPLLCSGKGSIT